MLNFLRKHQRIFFIFITVAIVVSFAFFGTYSTMGQQEAVPDKEIVKGVYGVPIMQQEVTSLCRLIEHSAFDGYSEEKGGMPNFFNDGVIEKDFMSSGLGVMLGKRYFDELKPDLDIRVKKIHHFRPYVHPKSAQISTEGTWARFSPSLLEHFRILKEKSDQATAETLAMMCQLYLDQAMLSPHMLKQILLMQQNQQGLPVDPVLANADLSLFGFKSVEDWFGPRFTPLVAQFILNVAQIAEKNGYDVKIEEVRADLFQNIHRGYGQVSRNATLTPEEASHYYYQKIRSLGMDESTLIGTWKKVMLFRRLFEDGSGSVLIDPLAYQQFDQFAKENVHLCLYQLPQPLQLTNFRSLLKFQLYLESIAQDPSRLRRDLAIPRQFASLEQIEKKAPELVEQQLELEYTSVSKEELSREISVRETWEWEGSSENWEKLKANFPEISTASAANREQRLALLDTLEEKLRVKIDQFARAKMVESQPEKILFALKAASVKPATVGLRKKGCVFPFAGVKEGSELISLLENAALRGEAPNAANDRLNFYSADKENYYQIDVVQRSEGKRILTFEKAVNDGTLDKMLDKRLEDSYVEVRRKDAHIFQQTNGQWKPFKEVKDQIGKVLYADLLKSIEEEYRDQFGFLPGKAGDLPLSFYSNARMLAYMKQARAHLETNPDDDAWIKANQDTDFTSQWFLIKADKMMERCTEVTFPKDELFTLSANQWSPVKIGERGSLAFYWVKEKADCKDLPLESMHQGHQILSFDAKKDMMAQMLQKIHRNKAIDLSYLTETR